MKNWENLKALFSALNEETEYLVLRNFEEFSDEKFLSSHPDIDFLCRDQQKIVQVTGAVPRGTAGDYTHCKIMVGGHEVFADMWTVGDGYYDSVWGLDMLKSRVLYENLCYVPDEKNYLYSLLYHSLVQKHQMSEDYKERIRKMSRNLGQKPVIRDHFRDHLESYMRAKGYHYTYPALPGGIANFENADRSLILKDRRRQMARVLYQIKKRIKKLLHR